MLCDHIQPVRPAEQSICARTAIQEGSMTLFHAICFTSAAHESFTSSEVFDPRTLFQRGTFASRLQNSAIQHKVAAISSLNAELSKPSISSAVTISMILSVTVLLTAEVVLGDDPKAMTAHLDGLYRMVSLNGGESGLPESVKAQIRIIDIKTASILQSRPRFDLYTAIAHQIDGHLELSSPLHPPGPKCSYFLCFSELSPDLRRCVDYTDYLVRVIESLNQGQKPCEQPSLDDFIALEHAILSSDVRADSSDLDICLRLALLLYCNTALWKTPLYFNWIVALRARLMRSLLAMEQRSLTSYYDDFLLWAFLLGQYAAAPGGVEEKIIWDLNVRRVSTRLGLWQWSHTQAVIGSFLSSWRVYGHTWGSNWNHAVLGNGHQYTQPLPKHPCVFNSSGDSDRLSAAYVAIDTVG